jgi:hypothetical protein
MLLVLLGMLVGGDDGRWLVGGGEIWMSNVMMVNRDTLPWVPLLHTRTFYRSIVLLSKEQERLSNHT